MKDLYSILGTDRDCTPVELNRAYRKLAQKFQPEGQEQDAFLDGHFQEITEAYQVLSDPEKRRKYDTAFKKYYQRRLYYFKIKHLNVAATLTLLVLTALFGAYILKMISREKPKKIATVQTILPAKTSIVHHKRKHSPKTFVAASKPSVAKDTVSAYVAKVEPVKSVKTPVDQNENQQADDQSQTVYLKANVTGIIHLHETPAYNSPVVVSIPDHSKVHVLEKQSEFYKVDFNGKVGYVPVWTVANW